MNRTSDTGPTDADRGAVESAESSEGSNEKGRAVGTKGPTAAIATLDRSVVERIAAGEVVTRPASVVKELVENSLDADASTVTVRVEKGGKRGITVADDGRGMGSDDALLAVDRHTTSKIRGLDDVDHVSTLGFRGEALASIARMSRLTLTTKASGVRGTEITVADGEKRASVAGRDIGTTVEVSDLFYNTPARRKSLASTKREFAAISSTVTRYALCRPAVRFRLEHGGRTVFSTPGSGRYTDAILGTYGREVAAQSIEIGGDEDDGTRSRQNADADDNAATGHDGDGGGGTSEGSGIDEFDIEVTGLLAYPSATRATSEHIYTAVNGRALRDSTIRGAVLDGYGSLLSGDRYPICVLRVSLPPETVDVNVHPSKADVAFHDPDAVADRVERAVRESLRGADLSRIADLGFDLDSSLEPIEGDSVFETASVIGRFREAYVLCEADDDLLVVDQHAAVERINYERLQSAIADSAVASASIDPPTTVALSPTELATLNAEREEIEKIGFAVETSGGGMCRVAGVPAPFGEVVEPTAIRDVLGTLSEGTGPEDPREELLKTIACHPSLKAGDDLSTERADELLSRLGACEQPFACPHGRPTVLSIDERAFVRGFERPSRRLG